MGADSQAENTPNKFQPKISAQAQKFKSFEKSSLWVSVDRVEDHFFVFAFVLM